MVSVLAGAGCATQAMKGTPFYTGEWEQRTGPVEERVALWPLVYYRAPALSVLWPIFEKTPDHIAVRPLYTVEGLESGHKVHNVLWPLGRFDTGLDESRFFPFFWGTDYFIGFPLLWHFGSPVAKGEGADSLFPLWIYYTHGGNAGDHQRAVLKLVWPLTRFERGARQNSNRIFPLFWQSSLADGEHWFYSLPLGLYASPHDKMKGSWVFPLYMRMSSPEERFFHTLLGGNGKSGKTDYGWLLPMLGGWRTGPDESMSVAGLGLWLNEKGDGHGKNWLVPLYYRSWVPGESSFYTLLGGGTHRTNGTGRLITPFYMRFEEEPGKTLTAIPPALSWRRQQPDRTDNWLLLGLSRFSSGSHPLSSYIFPLWYNDPQSGMLLTPLYQKGGDPTTDVRWHAVAPLYYNRTSNLSSVWATPLWAVVRRTDGSGRTLTPLYIHVQDKPDESISGVPPLLSWRHTLPDRTDDWLLLGLARLSHGEKPGASHLLPLVYRNPASDTLLSPLWAHWESGTSKVSAVPPLLSWRRRDADGGQATRFLAGLASVEKKADGHHQRSYLFPLYYLNSDSKTLLSPLYASWGRDGDIYRLIPPLLSWRRTAPNRERDTRLLLGLAGRQTSAKGELQQSYLFPLYAYKRNEHFYTPIYGNDGPKGDYSYVLTPLVGRYRNDLKGSWVWPLYRRKIDARTGDHHSGFLWGSYQTDANSSSTSFFPFMKYLSVRWPAVAEGESDHKNVCQTLTREENSLSLLLLYRHSRQLLEFGEKVAPRIDGTTYREQELSQNRLFPLWSFEKREFGEGGQAIYGKGSVLWKLYDVKREQRKGDAAGNVLPHDYVRRRILWRFWHYERLNGEVSVDSFPFITYDRKPDGFRKTSFMWRGFRYETHPDGTKKLDLFFLPLWRHSGEIAAPKAE